MTHLLIYTRSWDVSQDGALAIYQLKRGGWQTDCHVDVVKNVLGVAEAWSRPVTDALVIHTVVLYSSPTAATAALLSHCHPER